MMEYCMKRIVVVLKQIAKAEGNLTPKASILLEEIKNEASNYSVMWNGTSKYQVRERGGRDKCVVYVNKWECSCRRWELIGMPCKHAVAFNWTMAQYGMQPDLPETWVSKVYWMDTWKKVYKHTINPINGVNLWTPSQVPTTLLPPSITHRLGGHPRRERKVLMRRKLSQ
ncbi:putative Zinc finger, SWIM-type [Helianthus debilis subsp. tardiflorus]